jgi:hypothetical protein
MASNSREEVMRKSRLSEEQMVKILREADKASVAKVSKKHAARAVAWLTHAALGWISLSGSGTRPPEHLCHDGDSAFRK